MAETLGTVTEATIAGLVADAKGLGGGTASIEVIVTKVVAAMKADEAKVKADAVAWYKDAVLAVGSRAVYAGLGAVAMFAVLHL